MKHKDTASALVGTAFFAIPYLALSVPVLPSLAIGAAAFCAGELVFTKSKNKGIRLAGIDFDKVIEEAKKKDYG